MTETTKEQRDELRRLIRFGAPATIDTESYKDAQRVYSLIPALLDAADERDRLRAENERLRYGIGDAIEIATAIREYGFAEHLRDLLNNGGDHGDE